MPVIFMIAVLCCVPLATVVSEELNEVQRNDLFRKDVEIVRFPVEAKFPLGNLRAAKTLVLEIVLKNRSGVQLAIEKVITSCGCLKAESDSASDSLADNEDRLFRFRFATPASSGAFAKQIEIRFGEQRSIFVEICGNVEAYFKVDPQIIDISDKPTGEFTLLIHPLNREKITGITSKTPGFEVKSSRRQVSGAYECIASVLPSTFRGSQFRIEMQVSGIAFDKQMLPVTKVEAVLKVPFKGEIRPNPIRVSGATSSTTVFLFAPSIEDVKEIKVSGIHPTQQAVTLKYTVLRHLNDLHVLKIETSDESPLRDFESIFLAIGQAVSLAAKIEKVD